MSESASLSIVNPEDVNVQGLRVLGETPNVPEEFLVFWQSPEGDILGMREDTGAIVQASVGETVPNAGSRIDVSGHLAGHATRRELETSIGAYRSDDGWMMIRGDVSDQWLRFDAPGEEGVPLTDLDAVAGSVKPIYKVPVWVVVRKSWIAKFADSLQVWCWRRSIKGTQNEMLEHYGESRAG